MTKQEVLDAANVMIAYANGKKVGTRPRRSMEPLLKILYVPTWNWEQKDYCIIPDHAAKESLEQSQGGQAVSHIVDAHVAYCKTISELDRDKTELRERIKRLKTAGNELRNCASYIGTVASGEGSVIRRTQEAIQSWDKEVK